MAKTQVLLKIIVNLKGFFIGIYNFSLFSGFRCLQAYGVYGGVWYGSEATLEKDFVQRRLLMGLRNIFMDMFNNGTFFGMSRF